MENPFFTERRSFPRFPISIPTSCFDLNANKKFLAYTHDISAQGMCVVMDHQLPPGITLDIMLNMLDNEEKIYRQGKVVWSNETESGKYRIGIRLEEPTLNPIPLVLRTIMAQNCS